jgi:glutaconate CoA-transferase, subunit A
MGVPFMPVRGVIGTDYLRIRPDFRVIRNPYGNDDIAVVPAIRPDVCVFHAFRADSDGNVIYWSDQDNWLLAQAARRVIVTVEEIAAEEVNPVGAEALLSSVYVDAIVHQPSGAWPTGCPGRYDLDASAVEEYVRAAADQGAFRTWLMETVLETQEECQAQITRHGEASG